MSIHGTKDSNYSPKNASPLAGTTNDPKSKGEDQPGVPSGGPDSKCNFTKPAPKRAP